MYSLPPIIMQGENEKMMSDVSKGAIFHFYDSSFPFGLGFALAFGVLAAAWFFKGRVVGQKKQELYGEMVVSYDIELAI